jgi:hypothetical protein
MSLSRICILSFAAFFAVAGVGCDDEPEPQVPGSPADPAAEGAAGEATEDVQVAGDADADAYADTDPSALTDLRAPLEGHGQWVDDPAYGTIWVPDSNEVGADFAPYTSAGHWVYDDEEEEYVWVSDYDWGWVPFHYGRWLWIEGRRWCWVPGRTYAGAWVTWRVGPAGYGYVGWGPTAPRWVWRGGVAVWVAARPAPVVFCDRSRLFEPRVREHLVVGERVRAIAQETHDYAPPAGTKGGRYGAVAEVRGPPPASLGIDRARVAHVTPGDAAVARARVFARPSTARAAGAHAPSAHVIRVPSRRGSGGAGAYGHGAAHPSAPHPGHGGHGGGHGRH